MHWIEKNAALVLSLATGLAGGAFAVGISFARPRLSDVGDPKSILYILEVMQSVLVMNAIATVLVCIVLRRREAAQAQHSGGVATVLPKG